ncbi:hypothetical protein NMK34_10145 [Micromonospora sp. BRA006-A]|uniref:hypothetical protein n=1 Tax=Micromonospora sp. BRA006-A TaxID=2962860 RepID=UPI00296E689D|nr:hypothetical protein [Micromonospora sp. BRA006-A]MDW3846964.1 hypothetical protein [Micromonospora sp. BRA006-A]MEE3920287.1 hypothetical protein [Micromonospora sp. BRA006-A]
MERFEGRCWLDWWANSSTVLGSVKVAIVIAAVTGDWEADGRLVSASDEDREAFAFLCELDPVFTLRFEDGSVLAVTVQPTDRHRRFTLTEYTGPVQQAVVNRIALQANRT